MLLIAALTTHAPAVLTVEYGLIPDILVLTACHSICQDHAKVDCIAMTGTVAVPEQRVANPQ